MYSYISPFSLFLLVAILNFSFASSRNRTCSPPKCYKSSSPLQGIFPVTFIPFDEHGNLNLEPIPKYAKYLADNGADGCLINGIYTGGVLLPIADKKKHMDAWVKAAKPYGLTVIFQIGLGLSYKDAEDLAAYAKLKKVGAILITSGFHAPNTSETAVTYMAGIAKAAYPTPAMYFKSQDDKFNLNIIKFVDLAVREIPNFAGVIADFINSLGVLYAGNLNSKLSIFNDDAYPIAASYASCLNGTSTVANNVFLDWTVKIKEAIEEGDVATASEYERKKNIAIASCLAPLNNDVLYGGLQAQYAQQLRHLFMKLTGINVGIAPSPAPQIPEWIVHQCIAAVNKLGINCK